MPLEIILIITFTIFSIVVEQKYKIKKNKNLKNTIPEIPPAELKYYYQGLVNERDLTSIIIELAQKKYLKITPRKIIKQRKYKEKNKSEELMYKSLFKKGNSIEIKDLHKNLYKDISTIIHSIDNINIRKETNEKEQLALNNYLVIFSFIIFLIIYIHLPYNIIKTLIITIITWIAYISLIRVYTSKNNIRSKLLVTILTITLSTPFYLLGLNEIIKNKYQLITFVIGHLGTIVIINTLNSLTPKTKAGQELKTEAEKFNNYLININNEEILKKDPDFLEKIFPYAYAFNHTFKIKRILKKNNIKLKWFEGNEIELTETLIKIKKQIIKSGHKE